MTTPRQPLPKNLPFVIVDIETTSLDLGKGQIYDIAIIRCESGKEPRIFRVQLAVDHSTFDPVALEMYEAHKAKLPPLMDPKEAAAKIAAITNGCVFVGNNPSFDASRIERLLLSKNLQPSWHFQLEDVEARAAQHLGVGPPPWSSSTLSLGLGIDRNLFDQHSAIGDARWTMMQYEILIGKDLGSSLLGELGMLPGRELS